APGFQLPCRGQTTVLPQCPAARFQPAAGISDGWGAGAACATGPENALPSGDPDGGDSGAADRRRGRAHGGVPAGVDVGPDRPVHLPGGGSGGESGGSSGGAALASEFLMASIGRPVAVVIRVRPSFSSRALRLDRGALRQWSIESTGP